MNDDLTKWEERILSWYSLEEIVNGLKTRRWKRDGRKRKDEKDEEDHFLKHSILKDWLFDGQCCSFYRSPQLHCSKFRMQVHLELAF